MDEMIRCSRFAEVKQELGEWMGVEMKPDGPGVGYC